MVYVELFSYVLIMIKLVNVDIIKVLISIKKVLLLICVIGWSLDYLGWVKCLFWWVLFVLFLGGSVVCLVVSLFFVVW